MKKYEIIIIGAGPGGLKAAEILAKKGKQVLVLEKNSVIGDKVCAGGLTLKDFELGIPERIVDKKFKKVILHTPLQKTTIKEKKVFLATVDRIILGNWMAQQAEKAGAEIKTNSRVTKINKNSVIVNKEEIRFNYLIGADGSNSMMRTSLGLKDQQVGLAMQYKVNKVFKNLEVFLDYDKFGPWYSWIFPHKDYTFFGTGGNPKTTNMKILKKNFNKWCRDKFDIKKAEFQAHTIRYGYEGHKFGKKFLIGEAAGFASSLTGEGIYFAMLSGIDVAKKIINPKYKCRNIEHILKVKKIEDGIIKHWEKHKILTEIEFELTALLTKSKWIDKKLIANLE